MEVNLVQSFLIEDRRTDKREKISRQSLMSADHKREKQSRQSEMAPDLMREKRSRQSEVAAGLKWDAEGTRRL